MSRSWLHCIVVFVLALTGCAGGAGFSPAQHRSSSAARSTMATFTIVWTNASAPAAVRRKDTISPSAQSVTVSINGTLTTAVNRNTSPSQSITLDAPVGTDLFAFNVYDTPNGAGRWLGTATVSQLIVDGAANVVTAVIQAVCAATNVQVITAGKLAQIQTATSGIYAASLQSIELTGPQPATLQVGPEDADGNVIISGTGGTVAAALPAQATITPINGAQISLVPSAISPTATASTLTVAASSCPTTTIAVKSSPLIYIEFAQGAYNFVFAYDWYGNTLGTSNSAFSNGVLVGYDTRLQEPIAYNSSNGGVYSVSQDITASSYMYTVPTGAHVTWSNYAHSVFGAHGSGTTTYFTYKNGGLVTVGSAIIGTPVAVTSSTLSSNPAVFATNGTALYGFSLATDTEISSYSADYPTTALATDDTQSVAPPSLGSLLALNSNTNYPYSVYPQSLASGFEDFGGAASPALAATDTDVENLYYIYLYDATVVTYQAGYLSPNLVLQTPGGTPLAIVVASTNER